MINPILTQLNQPVSNNQSLNLPIQQIKDLMNQVKMSSNQQAMIQNLLNQNPNLRLLLSGGSLQSIAQELARQKGVDLNELIRQLQN